MNVSQRLMVATALLVAAPAVVNAQPRAGDEGVFLIRGATVWTGTGQTLQNANVLIRGGRIEAVGANVTAQGATEIDARGKFVYPGMTDAYTGLGLNEVGGIATMNLRSEMGEFNPHMRAVVAINVDSEILGVTRANGVTSAITAPSGGVISGQAGLINTAGWTWEDMAVRPTAAYVINYPRAGGGGGFGGGGGPPPGAPGQGQAGQAATAARERVERQIRDLKQMIVLAKAYDMQRTANAGKLDVVYESMRPLVRGEAPVLIPADTEEQIRTAIEFAEEMGLKLVLYGGRDAWKVRTLLAQKNVPLVLGSIQSTPANDAPYDAIYAQPGLLHEAGVKFAFSTGSSGTDSRHVPFHASLAVAYGLPADAAMKALTVWPAEIFGAADQIGTIATGKMANLFITSGDPLDIRSVVSEVFIRGRRVPMDDRHNRLYQKYNGRPGGGN